MAIPREPTIASEDEVDIRVREDFLRPTVAGLRGGLTIRENFRAYVTPEPITFTTPDDWVPLTLNSAAGWRNLGGAFPSAAVRKQEDGLVVLREIVINSLAPAAPSTIAILPVGYEPAAVMRRIVEATGATVGSISVFPSTLAPARAIRYNAGVVTGFLQIATTWTAADRVTPAYTQSIKLPQVPFRPELVWVHATDTSGREQVVRPRWQPATQGIVLQRLPGLAPLTKYSLMVYALAG